MKNLKNKILSGINYVVENPYLSDFRQMVFKVLQIGLIFNLVASHDIPHKEIAKVNQINNFIFRPPKSVILSTA